jgi:hypothetical protein
VEAILNRPMLAAEGENTLRIGTFGSHAGNSVDGFGAELLRDRFCGVALNGENLGGMWGKSI